MLCMEFVGTGNVPMRVSSIGRQDVAARAASSRAPACTQLTDAAGFEARCKLVCLYSRYQSAF